MLVEIIATDIKVAPDKRNETPVCIDTDDVTTFGRATVGIGTVITFKNGMAIETTCGYKSFKETMARVRGPIVNLTHREDS